MAPGGDAPARSWLSKSCDGRLYYRSQFGTWPPPSLFSRKVCEFVAWCAACPATATFCLKTGWRGCSSSGGASKRNMMPSRSRFRRSSRPCSSSWKLAHDGEHQSLPVLSPREAVPRQSWGWIAGDSRRPGHQRGPRRLAARAPAAILWTGGDPKTDRMINFNRWPWGSDA
jgi:hypothetical protein